MWMYVSFAKNYDTSLLQHAYIVEDIKASGSPQAQSKYNYHWSWEDVYLDYLYIVGSKIVYFSTYLFDIAY